MNQFFNVPQHFPFRPIKEANRDSIITPKSYFLRGFKVNSEVIESLIDFKLEDASGDQVKLMINENLYPGVIFNLLETKSKQFKFIIRTENPGKESLITIRPKDIFEIKSRLKLSKKQKPEFNENLEKSEDKRMRIDPPLENQEENLLTFEELLKFVGESVYFISKRQEIRLAKTLEEIQANKRPKKYSKAEICAIASIDYEKIITSTKISISTALFYRYSKIDPSYPLNLLINRRVQLMNSTVPRFYQIKLLPALKKQVLVELEPASIDEQHPLPSIKLLKDTQNINTRFRFHSSESNLNKTGLIISNPVRSTLSFALSLSLLENFYRFPKISTLNKDINPNIQNSATIQELRASLSSSNRNMGDFYSFVYRYSGAVQKIGEEILADLSKSDFDKISGFQSLADFLGIIINFYNFSEEFYKIIIEPSSSRDFVEIIHLGQMNKSYFVVYPDEIINFEMSNNEYKTIDSWLLSPPFIRCSKNQTEEKLLQLMTKVSKNLVSLSDLCYRKAKGLNAEFNFDPQFKEEINEIKTLAETSPGLNFIDFYNVLISVDANKLIYDIPIPKFTCLCCREKYPDTKEFKETLNCGCEYKKEHYEQKVAKTFNTCFCGNSIFASANYSNNLGYVTQANYATPYTSNQYNPSNSMNVGNNPAVTPQMTYNPLSSPMNYQTSNSTFSSNHPGVRGNIYPNWK